MSERSERMNNHCVTVFSAVNRLNRSSEPGTSEVAR
jgi:hypothetical protein